ncbi:MAG TPA: hypothetical protein DD490_21240 [Acidobacteria bacterium]|nr:hypothetical protein [Acidobacteriota bacterium]
MNIEEFVERLDREETPLLAALRRLQGFDLKALREVAKTEAVGEWGGEWVLWDGFATTAEA